MVEVRIIVGCYEEMIVCYDVVENDMTDPQSDDNKFKYKLKLSFTDHPHSGSVRCITVSQGKGSFL
jgi:hypothetical protein